MLASAGRSASLWSLMDRKCCELWGAPLNRLARLPMAQRIVDWGLETRRQLVIKWQD